MIVQVVGHGLIEHTVPSDVFTIRFRDWQWQMADPKYGTRTDVTVINVNPNVGKDYDAVSEVWCCRPYLMAEGRRDISEFCARGGDAFQSTGSSTIWAAHNLLKPDRIVLHGFTALQSGKSERRYTNSKRFSNDGMTHAKAKLSDDRAWFEKYCVPIEFAV